MIHPRLAVPSQLYRSNWFAWTDTRICGAQLKFEWSYDMQPHWYLRVSWLNGWIPITLNCKTYNISMSCPLWVSTERIVQQLVPSTFLVPPLQVIGCHIIAISQKCALMSPSMEHMFSYRDNHIHEHILMNTFHGFMTTPNANGFKSLTPIIGFHLKATP